MKASGIICHYDEIGLKGRNRNFFEKRLIDNIKLQICLAGLRDKVKIKNLSGRISIELKNCSVTQEKKIASILQNTFGLSSFSFAYQAKSDLEKITVLALKIFKNKKFKSFRITTKRSNKSYPSTSPEISAKIGEAVLKKYKKKVDLKNPDLTCFLEIVGNYAYLYIEKIKGLSGLPVGTSGKAVCLLSGGIDSPVASWYAAKRGLKIIFVHFHSYPQTNKASIDKVRELVKKLQPYTLANKLILCPFLDLQKKIFSQVPESLRIIFYRRLMLKIAEKIAIEEKAQAIITGEALGQVASQTIENIGVISEAVTMPILRPLIGFDKKEIIARAQEIGTFDISIQPHGDCCIVFMPKNPKTRAKLKEIQYYEKNLNLEELTKQTIAKLLGKRI